MQSKIKTENPPPERVKHLHCLNEQQLCPFLEQELNLTPERSQELLSLGAIYLNKVRVLENILLQPGDYIRAHLHPRRNICHINLKERIIFENNDFLILDKPADIPAHPTVDNYQENILEELKKQLGIPIYLTHRLDRPTQGLILYAKTKKFQAEFYKLLANNQTEKIYEARVDGDFPFLGSIKHWMEKSELSPKKVSAEFRTDWLNCELVVLEKKLSVSPTNQIISVLKIKLITGRTHQIRAQLAALGFPIINDVLYGAKEIDPKDWIALKAVSLKFLDFEF